MRCLSACKAASAVTDVDGSRLGEQGSKQMGNLIEWLNSAPTASERETALESAQKLVAEPKRYRRTIKLPTASAQATPAPQALPAHLNVGAFLMQAFSAPVSAPAAELAVETAAPEVCKANSGKRDELLARLLNPTITLEETALILDTCPTTVRRYANMGLLTHVQAPGDQKRYRLSDVLAVMQNRDAAGDIEPGPDPNVHKEPIHRARHSMKKTVTKTHGRDQGAETD
jgi:hypothetical protein